MAETPSSDDLAAENRELRRQLQLMSNQSTASPLPTPGGSVPPALPLPTSGGSVPPGLPPSTPGSVPPRYKIEQMSEGFWDGQYRVRSGFRIIGYFDSSQEAWDHIHLDFAQIQNRIGPRPTPSSRDNGRPTIVGRPSPS